MRALSIRQPFAELILRGVKTVEYRSRPTRIIGQRFWIYACKGTRAPLRGERKRPIIADNIVPEAAPPWMIELANALRLFDLELPTGMIVGSAMISRCTPPAAADDKRLTTDLYQWHLTDVERLSRPKRPRNPPQPVWFQPF